jgi:hypothetical protein
LSKFSAISAFPWKSAPKLDEKSDGNAELKIMKKK